MMAVLGACNATTPVTDPADPATIPPHVDYVIQPGDLLQISVWKEKDLMGDVLVRPDGGINFPLIGDVVVSGMTLEQARKELTAKLSKYVPDPVVTIAVKQAQGYKVYVIGKVNRPGEFVANRDIDVMQALSLAGGLSPYASVNKIKILRKVNGELKTFPFKYSRVEKGEDLQQNIVLQGGDVVIVP
jgi:polysaccharide export outer membrane protein